MARRRRRGEHGKGTVFRPGDREGRSITWRENGVREYEHGFPSEADARKRLAVVQGDIAAGRATRAQLQGKRTLRDLAQQWLKDRKATHRAAYDDANRWENHLRRAVDHLTPNAVTIPVLKAFIASKHRQGVSTTTVSLLVRLLSTLYTDLVEAGHASSNPGRQLSKATSAKYLKPAHDPKRTPFLEKMEDVVADFGTATGKLANKRRPRRPRSEANAA